jgi:ribonuclease P protein component
LALSKKSASKHINSFDRSRRITKKSDFSRLRKHAKKWVSRHWILFYSKNEVEQPRLAVTISARYGNAVARNKLRRLLREMFRLNQDKFPGFDLHFIAKQKPAQLEFSRYKKELHEDFQRMLDRLS